MFSVESLRSNGTGGPTGPQRRGVLLGGSDQLKDLASRAPDRWCQTWAIDA